MTTTNSSTNQQQSKSKSNSNSNCNLGQSMTSTATSTPSPTATATATAFANERLLWESKQIQVESVPEYIPNGSSVYIGSTAATPEAVLRTLVDNWNTTDIQIVQMLPGGSLPHLYESIDRFRTLTFFSYSTTMYYDMNPVSSVTTTNNNNNSINSNMTNSINSNFNSSINSINSNNNNNNKNGKQTNTTTTTPATRTATATATATAITSSITSINRKEGLADYKPMSLSSIGRLLREKIVTVDIAVIKVTKPHKGFCSLGFGVDCTLDFIQHASIVIAEVTDAMPWTEGPSKVPISIIDYWIDLDELNDSITENGNGIHMNENIRMHKNEATRTPTPTKLKTTNELWPSFISRISGAYPSDVLDKIGINVAKEIPNGATLKFDWNPLGEAIFSHLRQHTNLGLHTDMYVDSLYQLQVDGIINNSQKTINTGRTVVSQAHGSTLEFYDYLDRNPAIEFHPISYVNDPKVLCQIHNLIVIIVAFKIDITGQVTTDSVGHKFYGGIWSTSDSMNGVKISPNGKPIIVLPSKSRNGNSNIVFALPPGTGISISRSDVEYVVTEYGTAYLYGKSIRERCLALIEIAHPDFRTDLFTHAKEHQYLSKSQPGFSFQSLYPEQYESTYYTKKTNRSVLIRPIKAADEDLLRTFFHKLSDHSVYLRYFRRMRSMSHQILQRYTDLDYSNNMALLALYPKSDNTKTDHTPGPNSISSSNNNNNNNNNPDNSSILSTAMTTTTTTSTKNSARMLTGSISTVQYELIAIGQWISDMHDGIPEIAFQVRDDWQGDGLATFLFIRLVEIASSTYFSCTQFKADVLAENRGMRHVFESSGIPYKTRSDFGVITYIFDLPNHNKKPTSTSRSTIK